VLLTVKKTDLNTLIDQHSMNNKVLKFEIDFYTGSQHNTNSTGTQDIHLGLYYNPTKLYSADALVRFSFIPKTGYIGAICKGNSTFLHLSPPNNNIPTAFLPFNTWVTFIVYLDYNNKKAYFETPYFNTI